MTASRRFRFGVELHEPLPGRSWADSVREVEASGYSTMFVPDHFDEGLGPVAALASAATVSTTLNVGALVFDCDFRHPAVLARELATIDLLSEGRLEVGLGAGWKRLDYERSGIPMDPPKVRVDRMIEHTKILQQLFAGETVTFVGEHYQITALDLTPRPHRPAGPPILIGGGAKRVLRFAGATADIVGLNASVHSGEIDVAAGHDGLPERIDEKLGWLREGAGASVRRPRDQRVARVRRGHRRRRDTRRRRRRVVRDRREVVVVVAARAHRIAVRDRGATPGTA